MPKPVFHDKKLEIYEDCIIVKDCYAPGLDEKLRTSDIENVWVENLTFVSGKYRLGALERFAHGLLFTLEGWRETKL